MAVLYDRAVKVNIGGLLIESPKQGEEGAGLRVVFKIIRTLKKEPNTSELTIYNLSKASRSAIQEKGQEATIEAGYVDAGTSLIYAGEMEFGSNAKAGTDWVSKLQSDDGGSQFQQARVNESLKGPVSAGDVLKAAAEALGVGVGNALDKAGVGSIRGKLSEWTNGFVLSGKAEKELDKVLRSLGYSWSIQDGELQVLESTETIGDQIVLLKPGAGLIGSPEPGEDGFIKARALIQEDLQPGKQVKIESAEVNGNFRIEKTEYTGDTRGQPWYADIEAKPL